MKYPYDWLPTDHITPTAEELATEFAKRGLEYRRATFLLLLIGIIMPFQAIYIIPYFIFLILYITAALLLYRKQTYYENLARLQ